MYALYIASGALFHPASRVPFLLSSRQIFRQSGQIFSKKGQKLDFICSLWCFLGILGDNNGQNLNIFLKSRKEGRVSRWSAACLLACPLGAGGQGFEASGPAGCWRWSSGGVFRPFCPLSRFACGALLANMALFRILGRFLAGFSCSVWVCLAWVLCVACVAFVCVYS